MCRYQELCCRRTFHHAIPQLRELSIFRMKDLTVPMSQNIHTLKIKQTACQAWCLLRMLPLMVGHCVPHDSEARDVLIKLLDVTEYCTTSEVTSTLASFLADLIEDFLTHYYTVFPDMTMKPKFHYLVHYPEQLLEF